MKREKKFIFLIGFVFFVFDSYSMKISQAFGVTAGVTAVVGGLAAVRYDYKKKNQGWYDHPNQNNYVALTVGSTVLTGLLCTMKTSRGLLLRAKWAMDRRNPFVLEKILTVKDKESFVKTMESHYVTSAYPMVSAFEECVDIFKKSKSARINMLKALKVGGLNSEQEGKCKALLEELKKDDYWNQLEASIKAVKGNDQFLKQMNTKSLKDAADSAEANATANSINASANLMRRH